MHSRHLQMLERNMDFSMKLAKNDFKLMQVQTNPWTAIEAARKVCFPEETEVKLIRNAELDFMRTP